MKKRELLRIEDLEVTFPRRNGRLSVLDKVSFTVMDHEMVGLVGESGSGKTVTSLSVMRFLPPGAQIAGGRVWFREADLLSLSEEEMRTVRGKGIAMIYQGTRSALNPLMRVGDQVARAYQLQQGMSRAEAYQEAVALLSRVGIPDAERRARSYPHQLSGGMCQRVLVAIMLTCQPALLIADEPTTGLDVTIQAQIFELIKDVQRTMGTSILLITHDLGVVAETCQRVIVMYAGQVMEVASVEAIFARPRHPYTCNLLKSVLRADRVVEMPPPEVMPSEEVIYTAAGCRFALRCPEARAVCWEGRPATVEIEPDHWVMCHLADG